MRVTGAVRDDVIRLSLESSAVADVLAGGPWQA
jgi:hypothetical protein